MANETAVRADQAQKRKRETWRDWMPDDGIYTEVMTKPELFAALEAEGIKITDSTFRYWRDYGVLPSPVRELHNGRPRALYPSWFVPAIKHLRQMQESGFELWEIATPMRAWAINAVQWVEFIPDEMALKIAAQEVAQGYLDVQEISIELRNASGEVVHTYTWPARE